MKKLLFVFFISILFVFAATVVLATQDIPFEDFPISGTVEATGTNFQITDSEYLNITLDSTESIKARIESIPDMITMFIEANPGSTSSPQATSTQITISGLAVNTTYYKYQDEYHNLTEFVSDANGIYTYQQDLSQPHLVFIQTQQSTKFIKDDATGGDCTLIGTWDWGTKTCVLTQNVYETIQIDNNNITLDGGGYIVAGGRYKYGIYIYQKSGITVQNLNIQNSGAGIYLYRANNNIITNNNISNNYRGIVAFYGSNNNNINNNIIYLNNGFGINLESVSGNVVDNNTINNLGNSTWGIALTYSYYNILNNNNISSGFKSGLYIAGSIDAHYDNNIDTTNTINGKPIYYIKDAVNQIFDSSTNAGVFYCINCNNVVIKDLVLTNNHMGLFLRKTQNSRIENVTTSNNNEGIKLVYSDNNTLINNMISENYFEGLYLQYSDNNNLTGNNINSNYSRGIHIYTSINNTLTNNTISNNDFGITILTSNNQIYNNNFIDNQNQIKYWGGSGNIFNLSLPTGGNYWDNFNDSLEGCNDINNDNICDTPYVFLGGQDNYPWKTQNGWLPNQPPTLSYSQEPNYQTDGINPNNGFTSTDFEFKVVYTDQDNDAPMSLKLFIDEIGYDMVVDINTTSTPELIDGDYTNGEQYTSTTTDLISGSRQYRFEIHDGVNTVRLPETGELTFNASSTPVIIIPGGMGSYLDKDYGDGAEVWPNIDTMIASSTDLYLKDLILQQDGTEDPTRPMKVRDIIKKIDTFDFYDSLITEFQNNGYSTTTNLFIFPYDWRLDVASTTTSLLSDKINTILNDTGAEKVDIVAHSLGGLLTKKYVQSNQTNKDKINKVVFVATPHIGAPKAFKVLMRGDDMGFKVGPFSILNPPRVYEISQNFPSAYQLLPSQKYVNEKQRYLKDLTQGSVWLDYDDTKAFMALDNNNLNQTLFPKAEQLHTNTDNLDLTNLNIKTYNIVGCGTPTIGKIIAKQRRNGTIKYKTKATAGDKTVPLISSTETIFTQQYYANKIEHASLPSADGVRQIIYQTLNNQQVSTSSYSNIDTSTTVCDIVKGKKIDVFSPVQLHVYDSQGRHTGPDINGDIEKNIPDVQYTTFGESKSVFLPDNNENYTIKLIAENTGTFDMTIETIDNEIATQLVYYNNVQIQTLNTQAEIIITPNQTDYTLNIDQDGDQIFETQQQPDSILNDPTQAQDLTNPQTTISVSGTLGNNNYYVSDTQITLTTTDDNAGVLKTEYSIDNGQTWEMYTQPFTYDIEGTNTILYTSTDRADNTEPVKTEIVNIDKTNPSITNTQLQQEYTLNTTPTTFNFNAIDDISGIASVSATLNNNPLNNGDTINFNQTGSYQIVITAQDNAGNITTEVIDYNVIYNFGGFKNPIKTDGSGVYKRGRTLPTKFQLTDINNNYISTAINYLYLAQIDNDVIGTDEVALSTSNADTGNQFRYDEQQDQYIFNLDTDTMTAGTWQLKASLDDGKDYTVIISIRN